MNILILTSVYRDPSLSFRDRSTNVVNSFVKEWVKQGHRVVVIHNSHSYPRIIHQIPDRIKKVLEAKMGFPILNFDAVRRKTYIDNGANIFRIPVKKYIPHSKPSNYRLKKQTKRIINILSKINFKPDIVTGHWASPQMEIISELKKIYMCQTAIVLHGSDYLKSRNYAVHKYLPNIDVIGTRSNSQSLKVQKILDLDELPFVCYSGIPDEYLNKYNLIIDKFDKINKWKITYVGRLVKYKNIDSVIMALSEINDSNWEFNIVGDGGERTALEQLSKDLGCFDKVKFWNRVSRDTVMEILKDSHIFTMISTNEVFGLVYLEAMAASCLTIASKDGGVDGIIKNNSNGYLCKQGDSYELNQIFKKIMNSEVEEIQNIAKNAYFTANKYSDYDVAERYLKEITSRK